MTDGIVVVTSGFPRRSETFALNELLALERAGRLAAVFATKPGDGSSQPGAELLVPKLHVLSEADAAAQAAEVVATLGSRRASAVHGYFAHKPADVAARAAALLGVPYGFSTHARDARKVDPATLRARVRGAACIVACNDDVAKLVRDAGGIVRLVRHGADVRRFAPQPPPPPQPSLELVAVGRLVEKKGFDVLLHAVARLEFPYRLRIVGDGPLRRSLEQTIATLGLRRRVALVGSLTHRELPAVYASAHAVVVPSVEDGSGDRDGLPNVVVEAMAAARPVVASAVGAIESGVMDEITGLVVRPRDVQALSGALRRLAADAALRERLGRAGRRRALTDFDLRHCTDRLLDVLESAYA